MKNAYERKTMKGRDRFLALLLAAVMVLSSGVFSAQVMAAGQTAGQTGSRTGSQAQEHVTEENQIRKDIGSVLDLGEAQRKLSSQEKAMPTGLVESKILRIEEDPTAQVHDDAAEFFSSHTAPVRADGEEYKLNFSRGNTMEGYEQLLQSPKAEARRELYMMILKEASEFEQNKETAVKHGDFYYFTAFKYDQLGLNQTDVYEVYKLFMMDHPSCYWIEVSVCMLYDYNYCYLLVNKEFRTPRQRALANKAIKARLAEYKALTAGLTTNFEKELAIHDKIVEDVEYNYNDLTGPYSQSILGVMVADSGLTVCAGYAKAFSFLLRYYGVPNYYVEGYGNGGRHAWNLVQLDDGKWYWNDVTWDDGTSDNPYFNCPNRFFIKSHAAADLSCDRYELSYNLPAPAGKTTYSHPASIERKWIYKGHTYALYDTSLTWDEAEAACEAAGGTLAVITSAGEHNYMCKKVDSWQCLLGGHYDAEAGKWSWVNGAGWKKTFFSEDIFEPDANFCCLAKWWDNTWMITTSETKDFDLLCEWEEELDLNNLPSINTGYNEGNYYAGGTNIKKAKLTFYEDTAEYTGYETTPSFDITYGKKDIWGNIVYISRNSTDVGTASVEIMGVAGFTGKITKEYKITRRSLARDNITVHKLKNRTYTGKALKPVIRLDDDGWKLTYGVDYTLKWSNNVNPGTATITITGKGNYKGTIKATFKIVKK